MGFLLLTYTKQMLVGERRGLFFNGVAHTSANNLLSHTKVKRYKIRRKKGKLKKKSIHGSRKGQENVIVEG